MDEFRSLEDWAEDSTVPAAGLPGWAYTDAGFWGEECATVFASNWIFVAFAHEMPNPGDVIPVTVGSRPVLLVRNADGDISAFHNVCRHRCLKLVDAPANVGKLIRCPYHSWAYDLDGALRASPHFGGTGRHVTDGFDPAKHGLVPVRVHVWHDWVFVNLDSSAAEFEDYAAPLISRLEGIRFSDMQPVAVLDFGEIATNWKFVMENFIEPYHVPFVHRSTTDQPLADHHTIIDGPCLGSAVDLHEEHGTQGSLAVSSRYLALYPNFISGRYFPDQMGVYLNVPLGPGRMAQRRAIYKTDGSRPSKDETDALKSLWWSVHKEDHEMCERLQAGRASPVAEVGGVLSPHWEDSVRAFQELVAEDIRKGRSGNG